MAKIIELPEVLANQIAAGEVIERPASVVKELVENAIDADSHIIRVEIEESGLKSICVSDDGNGMAEADVALSLKRHATSKISKQADLFRIRTLGFRGEALPSIASVSQLTITTREGEATSGTQLISEGGEVRSITPIAAKPGTRILVENLFFNTPARLKYMKSLQAELGHIIDVLNRQSLAHPEIAFCLINDGREVLKTNGTGKLKETLAGVYGVNTAKKMIAIEAQDLDFEVTGYVSLPELTRANRSYITLIINGRYIKNFLLNRAILNGYGSKLMVGRFPIAVLSIKIDPYLADVNVHPTKQEVRLSKEKELMGLIESAIQEALSEQELIPDALDNLNQTRKRTSQRPEQLAFSLPAEKVGKEDYRPAVTSPVDLPNFTKNVVDETLSSPVTYETNDTTSSAVKTAKRREDFGNQEHPGLAIRSRKERQRVDKIVNQLEQEENQTFPELEYFGQMHGTYLFAQGQEGLYIIDQHAAQERVKYEYYREKIGEVDSSLQQLLVPYLFEFSKSDYLTLLERQDTLKEIGIHLEPYGDSTFILREHPIWLAEDEIESGIYEMCDMLLLTDQVSVKRYRAELAIMMSCKRSIKANHRLDETSARNLLRQLAYCHNPYNCPHGRPVLVYFSTSDMEKMFRRIQENHTSLRELGKY
ncbi:DNA mismatch repair endonuclease MutL [Streptococcus sp. DD12]|uniref:DNA mismatch repair endonuclease MutL n=1 Tax=Streptococcus sp. DD12 TaxID=1777880 RepID=UPI0007923921|nr:DNA mismatch repair endonuclease MutL [Streptococcus sp. DD12]KXT76069.1 DNA mismatch repair protein MutL [Streptococcus sp. DD12]